MPIPGALARGIKKIAPLSFLTDANEAMFTFLIRCLNKDKTRSLGKEKNNKKRRRAAAIQTPSIESVTKDMTAFFLTDNNERLISIVMRVEGER